MKIWSLKLGNRFNNPIFMSVLYNSKYRISVIVFKIFLNAFWINCASEIYSDHLIPLKANVFFFFFLQRTSFSSLYFYMMVIIPQTAEETAILDLWLSFKMMVKKWCCLLADEVEVGGAITGRGDFRSTKTQLN